jgi:hypothetical protein
VVADVQQNVVAEEVEEVEEATLLEQTDATSADESEEAITPAPAPSLKGRRVSVYAGKYRRAGVGVVECDRSWEVIDVRMSDGSLQTGLAAGTYSLLE